MPNWIITAIIAGLVAAAMQGTIMSLSAINAVIFYLSPLPLFLAGFSRGWLSAVLGTVVMAVLLTLVTGSLTFGLMSVISAGLAPIIASYLSMITRPVATPDVDQTTGVVANTGASTSADTGEGEARTDDREWYPEGRLILWLAVIAAFVTGVSILAMGVDFETYKAFISGFIDPLVARFDKQMPPGQPPFPKEFFTRLMISALPVAAAAIWLLATVTSMRIAIVVLTKTKLALRPWALFEQLAFPANSVIALLASLVGAYFLSGIPQLLALGAVGAFVSAFTILGLAIVHSLLGGNVARPMLLGLLYAGLLFFNWILAVPLTVLGLADLNFNFRKSKST